MRCDLCKENEACGTYVIQDSHPFSKAPTVMNLCTYCLSDLKDAQVHLTRVRGMPLYKIKFPKKKVIPSGTYTE